MFYVCRLISSCEWNFLIALQNNKVHIIVAYYPSVFNISGEYSARSQSIVH